MIFVKKLCSHLKAIWVAFCMFLKLFEIIYLLRLGSYLKELSSDTSLSPYSLLQVKSKALLTGRP